MYDFKEKAKYQHLAHGEKLETEALIVAQKLLVNSGLDFIPESYINFLKNYNGLKADGAYLFGASIDDDLDIVDKNEQMPKPFGTLLLGYNEFDSLVFNYQQGLYQIVDREDLKVLDSYSEKELNYALDQILNI